MIEITLVLYDYILTINLFSFHASRQSVVSTLALN